MLPPRPDDGRIRRAAVVVRPPAGVLPPPAGVLPPPAGNVSSASIQQLQGLAIEVAFPPRRDQVLVHGRNGGLSEASSEGDLRIPEVELFRQQKVMLL